MNREVEDSYLTKKDLTKGIAIAQLFVDSLAHHNPHQMEDIFNLKRGEWNGQPLTQLGVLFRNNVSKLLHSFNKSVDAQVDANNHNIYSDFELNDSGKRRESSLPKIMSSLFTTTKSPSVGEIDLCSPVEINNSAQQRRIRPMTPPSPSVQNEGSVGYNSLPFDTFENRRSVSDNLRESENRYWDNLNFKLERTRVYSPSPSENRLSDNSLEIIEPRRIQNRSPAPLMISPKVRSDYRKQKYHLQHHSRSRSHRSRSRSQLRSRSRSQHRSRSRSQHRSRSRSQHRSRSRSQYSSISRSRHQPQFRRKIFRQSRLQVHSSNYQSRHQSKFEIRNTSSYKSKNRSPSETKIIDKSESTRQIQSENNYMEMTLASENQPQSKSRRRSLSKTRNRRKSEDKDIRGRSTRRNLSRVRTRRPSPHKSKKQSKSNVETKEPQKNHCNDGEQQQMTSEESSDNNANGMMPPSVPVYPYSYFPQPHPTVVYYSQPDMIPPNRPPMIPPSRPPMIPLIRHPMRHPIRYPRTPGPYYTSPPSHFTGYAPNPRHFY